MRATNAAASRRPGAPARIPTSSRAPDPLDDWILELPADQVLEVTDDRLVPAALRAVDADDPERFDFRDRAADRRGPRSTTRTPGCRARTTASRPSALTDDGRSGRRDDVGRRVPVGADPHGRPARRTRAGGAPRRAGRRADDLRARCVQRRCVRARHRPHRARARRRPRRRRGRSRRSARTSDRARSAHPWQRQVSRMRRSAVTWSRSSTGPPGKSSRTRRTASGQSTASSMP